MRKFVSILTFFPPEQEDDEVEVEGKEILSEVELFSMLGGFLLRGKVAYVDIVKHEVSRGGKGGKAGQLSAQTPDGRAICFAYNSQGCSGNCGMVHVCRIAGCLGDHPMTQHGAAKH